MKGTVTGLDKLHRSATTPETTLHTSLESSPILNIRSKSEGDSEHLEPASIRLSSTQSIVTVIENPAVIKSDQEFLNLSDADLSELSDEEFANIHRSIHNDIKSLDYQESVKSVKLQDGNKGKNSSVNVPNAVEKTEQNKDATNENEKDKTTEDNKKVIFSHEI